MLLIKKTSCLLRSEFVLEDVTSCVLHLELSQLQTFDYWTVDFCNRLGVFLHSQIQIV